MLTSPPARRGAAKENTLRMGKLTANKRNSYRCGTPSTVTIEDRSPQQGMWRPSAPARLGPEGVDSNVQGMENALPVFITK
jgi:hypothetical protein